MLFYTWRCWTCGYSLSFCRSLLGTVTMHEWTWLPLPFLTNFDQFYIHSSSREGGECLVCLCWACNDRIFNTNHTHPTHLVWQAYGYTLSESQQFSPTSPSRHWRYFLIHNTNHSSVFVPWLPSSFGVLKINFAAVVNRSKSTVAFIIRDHCGHLIRAEGRILGVSTPQAELNSCMVGYNAGW